MKSQDGSLKVSWKAPASTGGSAVSSYRLSTDGGSTWATVTPTEAAGVLTSSRPV